MSYLEDNTTTNGSIKLVYWGLYIYLKKINIKNSDFWILNICYSN
jgi:hypothetical protein